MTAAIVRRSLLQGLCGVALVVGLATSSAMQDPVELSMVGDRVEQVREATPAD